MRALQVTELNGPESLEIREIDAPEGGDGVLIDVEAAGVAFPDLLLTRGQYQYKPDPPFTPGAEVAGKVVSAPEGSGFAEGDAVMAFTFGGFQERVVAMPHTTFPVPESFSLEQAAAFPMNYHTAHFALHRRGRLAEGETVLVHGAAGGVGTATIQVAKGAGARVIAVVSDERKAEVARKAGAHEVLLSTGDWVQGVREKTDGRGAELVMDPVGG